MVPSRTPVVALLDSLTLEPASTDDALHVAHTERLAQRSLEVLERAAGTGDRTATVLVEALDHLPREMALELLSAPMVSSAVLWGGRDDAAVVAAIATGCALPLAMAGVEWTDPLRLLDVDGWLVFSEIGAVRLARSGGARCQIDGDTVVVTDAAGSPTCIDVATLDGLTDRSAFVRGLRAFVEARGDIAHKVVALNNGDDPVGPHPKRELRLVEYAPADVVLAYERAFELVELAWPELATELRSVIRQVVLFDGVPVGFTNPLLPGSFFARRDDRTFFCLQRLVHESGHVRLFEIERMTKLFRGTESITLSSPWRPDPRPFAGVFHGAFVHTRLVELLPRLTGADELAPLLERIPVMRRDLTESVASMRAVESALPVQTRRMLHELAAAAGRAVDVAAGL